LWSEYFLIYLEGTSRDENMDRRQMELNEPLVALSLLSIP